jgi:hypothetical protein
LRSKPAGLFQPGIDSSEDRPDSRVVITVAFHTHRDFEAMLPQEFLIVVRTVLAAAICMMDAPLWR